MFIPSYLQQLDDLPDWTSLYVKGRPVWGAHLFDLEKLQELRQKTLAAIPGWQNTGGVLIFPSAPQAEHTLLNFLCLIAGELLWQKQQAQFTQFLDKPYLPPPGEGVNVWIIHQAPLFHNLALTLEGWVRPGRLAIATGPAEMWEEQPLKLPCLYFPDFIDFSSEPEQLANDFARREAGATDQIYRDLAETGNTILRQAHYWVVLGDAWDVPLPLELLAQLSQADPDTLAEVVEEASQQGILFWVEREKPPALLVSTRGEGYARRFFRILADAGGLALDSYDLFFSACRSTEREERYVILKLLQSWLAHSRWRWSLGTSFQFSQIRTLVTKHWQQIKTFSHAGSAAERLIWTQCLGRLGLFKEGKEVVETALKQDQRNVYLLQARAHLLSRWSQVDLSRQEEAGAAFTDACEAVPQNVYLWQARGVFEAERQNSRGAEMCFAQALRLDSGNIPALVARADMYLEAGEWLKAYQDVEQAERLDPGKNNIYVLHVRGRWHFFRGEWGEAQTAWQGLLQLDRRNLYALHSLGNMARRRGQWQEAAKHLHRALELAPENVAVLLELALLNRENLDHPNLALAQEYVARALLVEPHNPRLLVAQANLWLQTGEAEKAQEQLETLLRRWPENIPAWHVLGLCYDAKGDQKQMAECFRRIINQSRGQNLYTLTALADFALRFDRRDQAQQFLETAGGRYEDVAKKMPAAEKLQTLLELARLSRDILSPQAAKMWVEQAAKIDPHHPLLQKIQASLLS